MAEQQPDPVGGNIDFTEEARQLLIRAGVPLSTGDYKLDELAEVLKNVCKYELAASARTAAAIHAGTPDGTIKCAEELDKWIDHAYANEIPNQPDVYLLLTFNSKTRGLAAFRHRIDNEGMAYLCREGLRAVQMAAEVEAAQKGKIIVPNGPLPRPN